MKAIAYILGIIAAVICLTSCEPKATSGKGMVLPEGDFDRGKASFADLKCNRCHIVTGVEIAAYEGGWDPPLELGGTVYRVKTYGDLVTAITNPGHVISKKYKDQLSASGVSPMPSLIEEMSVGQLIDLVTFLHSRYVKLQPEYEYDYVMY
ncbi:MAG: sulfur-oxidizing protein SoxX [Verrucomicrobiales bacterium]|jgi:sulfur-oxidizing protein SoxX